MYELSPITTLAPKTTYGSTVTFFPNDVSLDKKIVSGAIKFTPLVKALFLKTS